MAAWLADGFGIGIVDVVVDGGHVVDP